MRCEIQRMTNIKCQVCDQPNHTNKEPLCRPAYADNLGYPAQKKHIPVGCYQSINLHTRVCLRPAKKEDTFSRYSRQHFHSCQPCGRGVIRMALKQTPLKCHNLHHMTTNVTDTVNQGTQLLCFGYASMCGDCA